MSAPSTASTGTSTSAATSSTDSFSPANSNSRDPNDPSAYDSTQRVREAQLRPSRRSLRILLIRHAQSHANLRPGEIGGRQNHIPLTEHGIQQAHRLGERFRTENLKLEAIYTSTARRTQDTAKYSLGEELAKTIVTKDDLLEMSQGSWETRLRHEVYTPSVLNTMNSTNWIWRAPGKSPLDGCEGESPYDVEQRMMTFVESLLVPTSTPTTSTETTAEDISHTTIDHAIKTSTIPTIAIFSHGVAIKCLLRGILESHPSRTHKFLIDNTSITEIIYSNKQGGKGGWFVQRINDAAHIPEDIGKDD